MHSLPLGVQSITSAQDSGVGIVHFSCWGANKVWKVTEPDSWLYVAFFQAGLAASRAATMEANSLLWVNNDNYNIESSMCFMNLCPQSRSCISQDYRENIPNIPLSHSQLSGSCRKRSVNVIYQLICQIRLVGFVGCTGLSFFPIKIAIPALKMFNLRLSLSIHNSQLWDDSFLIKSTAVSLVYFVNPKELQLLLSGHLCFG